MGQTSSCPDTLSWPPFTEWSICQVPAVTFTEALGRTCHYVHLQMKVLGSESLHSRSFCLALSCPPPHQSNSVLPIDRSLDRDGG